MNRCNRCDGWKGMGSGVIFCPECAPIQAKEDALFARGRLSGLAAATAIVREAEEGVRDLNPGEARRFVRRLGDRIEAESVRWSMHALGELYAGTLGLSGATVQPDGKVGG